MFQKISLRDFSPGKKEKKMALAKLDVSGALSSDSAKLSHLYLASFTNGRLCNDGQTDPKFACFESTNNRSKNTRLLVCETDSMQYTGRNTGPEAIKSASYCRQIVAAYNKRSGKVRLLDAQSVQMKPHFADDAQKQDKDETDLTFREQTDRLTTAFGSVKKRRTMESRLKNKIEDKDLESALSGVVDDVLSKSNASEIAVHAPVWSQFSTIPPHNKDGKSPSEVYTLEHIISEADMAAIEGPALNFVDSTRETLAEWTEKKVYPSYILHHLGILPLSEKSRIHKACCLMYLSYLMRLYQAYKRQINSKAFMKDAPKVVTQSIFSLFTKTAIVAGKKQGEVCIPASLKDKLLSYILVLCLILDDFQLVYNPLMVDLKLAKHKIETSLRGLGCSIKSDAKKAGGASRCSASLPVPLKLPVVSTRALKARK